MLKWIEFNSNQDDLTILVGDFNTLPYSSSYNLIIENGFFSSFSKLNGKEPQKTFHNKLEAPFKDASDEGTFDYIL